jgi:hypothetical protein
LLGFLPQDKSSNNLPVLRDFSMIGRIVSCYSYSLSEEAYNYYTHVNEQLAAENNLFDPISTNLVSNITCENNPSKKVVGLFEASGQSVKHVFIRYNENQTLVHYKNIGTEISDHIKDGVIRDHPPIYDTIPVFWQQF